MVSPCEATTATTIGVVRLPREPADRVLVEHHLVDQVRRSPTSTMARVEGTCPSRSNGTASPCRDEGG